MLATTWSAVWDGDAPSLVRVEVLVSPGLPSFSIVGAAEPACREARDRVRSAVLSSALAWPMRRITAGLAPSWIAKRGSSTDLALGVGVLAAAGIVLGSELDELCFIGELGLDGRVRAVPGGPALASVAGRRRVVVAPEAGAPSALVSDGRVAGVRTLAEAVRCLEGQEPWPNVAAPTAGDEEPAVDPEHCIVQAGLVWEDWAPGLAVTAAGGHAALFGAPSWAGWNVTRALWTLLPDLDRSQARSVLLSRPGETARSVDGGGLWRPPLEVLRAGPGCGDRRRDALSRALRRAQHGLLVVDVRSALSLGQARELGLLLARSGAWDGATSAPSDRTGAAGALQPEGSSALLVVLDDEEPTSAGSRRVGELLRRHVEIGVAGGSVGWPAWSGSSSTPALRGRVAEARRRSLERWGLPASKVPPAALERDAPLGSLERAQLAAFVERGGGDAESPWVIRRVARTVADLAGDAKVSSDHLQRAAELWAVARPRCR